LAWLTTDVALLPVVVLTLVPVDREVFGRCALQWALPTPGRVELMANVVLCVARVLLAGIASRRPVLVMASVGTSAGLEVLQALVPTIGRSCDTNDWLSNTIGAVIGAAIAWAALRWARGSNGR
jgi:VanZ family protein